MLTRVCAVAICVASFCDLEAQEITRDAELDYPKYTCQADDLVISRSDYHEKLQGFWLGECIANWTGLRTEGVKKTAPFFTDKGWGTRQGRNKQKIEFVLVEEGDVWGADDDTDIEYIYQISRTRINFPDHTPNQPGDDSFVLMAQCGIDIIDRVVIEEMGGGVDLDKKAWCIPDSGTVIEPAQFK